MKTNLLLLDSYRNIEDLIQFAFSFSNHYQRNLKITYVFDFNWMTQSALAGATGTGSAALVNAKRHILKDFEAAEDKMRGIVNACLKDKSVNFSIDIDASKNSRIDVISAEIQKDRDLMVIISNHQNYTEITGGLVSYPKLIEHVKCPVMIVPDNIRQAAFHNIVYASDYNPEDIRSLKHLSNFMKQSEHTHITILHNERDFDYQAKLKWIGFKDVVQSEIEGKADIDFSLKKENDFIKGMEDYNAETNADLMVMLNEKRGFLEDIFSSSTTKNVISHFDKPLLVYHEK